MLSYIKAKLQLILVGVILVLAIATKFFASRSSDLQLELDEQKLLAQFNARNDLLRKEFIYNKEALAQALKESKIILERNLDELRKQSIIDNSSSYNISV